MQLLPLLMTIGHVTNAWRKVPEADVCVLGLWKENSNIVCPCLYSMECLKFINPQGVQLGILKPSTTSTGRQGGELACLTTLCCSEPFWAPQLMTSDSSDIRYFQYLWCSIGRYYYLWKQNRVENAVRSISPLPRTPSDSPHGPWF